MIDILLVLLILASAYAAIRTLRRSGGKTCGDCSRCHQGGQRTCKKTDK